MSRRGSAVLLAAAVLTPALVLGACAGPERGPAPARQDSHGDPQRGAALIGTYGCGTCHQIPGIDNADGLVGPPLTELGRRAYIAGVLPNTPANLEHWIRHPQQVVPGNAMPDMGVSASDAADITAYLYKLR